MLEKIAWNRSSEERLRILFESAPDAIYVMDMEGRFTDGNQAAFAMSGYGREESIGKENCYLPSKGRRYSRKRD